MTNKLVRVVKSLYDEGRTIVQCSAGLTEPFPVSVGLHQGSALSPFLFAVVMDTVSCRIRQGVLDELVYADEIAISADTEEKLQGKIRPWQEELHRKGLKVNSRKTEVIVSEKKSGHQAELKG